MNKGSGEKRNIVIALSLGLLAIAMSILLHHGGLGLVLNPRIRGLSYSILVNTYNPWNKTLTSYSLNAVSAVIWDYRGVDTLFETTVLLTAVIGTTLLFSNRIKISEPVRETGVASAVVKFSTRIILILTALIAASIAIHGHLSPGGGFQAGTMLAVIVVFVIPVFTWRDRGLFSRESILLVRLMALLLIVITATIPLSHLLMGGKGYVMQNQLKQDSGFETPYWFIDTPLAGSIFIYNLLESIAVSTALIYVLTRLYELES